MNKVDHSIYRTNTEDDMEQPVKRKMDYTEYNAAYDKIPDDPTGIPDLLAEMKESFLETRQTFDIEFRISQLKKIEEALCIYEEQILDALFKDLGRPKFEGFLPDIMF